MEAKDHNSLQCQVMEVGEERTKVLVIDNALPNYVQARERAASEAHFFQPPSNYPGLNARALKPYRNFLLNFADKHARAHYPIPEHLTLRPLVVYYAHVTVPPAELNTKQSLPHFDNQLPTAFAALHYLSDGQHGGTGFFRHKLTGFERITRERLPLFEKAAYKYIADHGKGDPGYVTGSHEQFELIGQVDYKPNRILIYPGNLLHTPMIDPATDLTIGEDKKRLTANCFFAYSERPIKSQTDPRKLPPIKN